MTEKEFAQNMGMTRAAVIAMKGTGLLPHDADTQAYASALFALRGFPKAGDTLPKKEELEAEINNIEFIWNFAIKANEVLGGDYHENVNRVIKGDLFAEFTNPIVSRLNLDENPIEPKDHFVKVIKDI